MENRIFIKSSSIISLFKKNTNFVGTFTLLEKFKPA